MTDSCPDSLVRFAGLLADAAGDVAQRYFRSGVQAEDKADESPVTIADRTAEAAMRALIEKEFPEHGIIGEEHGSVRRDAEWVWVLDPIDGTAAFIAGVPVYSTLIALCRDGVPVVGVMDFPAIDARFLGVTGQQTRLNGARISRSARRDAAASRLASAWRSAASRSSSCAVAVNCRRSSSRARS